MCGELCWGPALCAFGRRNVSSASGPGSLKRGSLWRLPVRESFRCAGLLGFKVSTRCPPTGKALAPAPAPKTAGAARYKSPRSRLCWLRKRRSHPSCDGAGAGVACIPIPPRGGFRMDKSRHTCSRMPLVSLNAFTSSRPSKCLSRASMPSGDCLTKSKIDRSSEVVFGSKPSSIKTRLALCTVPNLGNALIVTLLRSKTSSTTTMVSQATCRSNNKSCAAASMLATRTWNFGRRAAATAAAAAAAALAGSLASPLPAPPDLPPPLSSPAVVVSPGTVPLPLPPPPVSVATSTTSLSPPLPTSPLPAPAAAAGEQPRMEPPPALSLPALPLPLPPEPVPPEPVRGCGTGVPLCSCPSPPVTWKFTVRLLPEPLPPEARMPPDPPWPPLPDPSPLPSPPPASVVGPESETGEPFLPFLACVSAPAPTPGTRSNAPSAPTPRKGRASRRVADRR
mmetsp:Transcript_1740/g.6571  ORF Transcript_1740/g.6571 Transcript_1740/m.6571 type:complete len:452 (-) Transcript_1740:2815-4170(-)